MQNTPEAVHELAPDPHILAQTRLFKVGDVYLVPLVARVGDTWYESWINPFADQGQGLVELEILAAQDRIVFLIYDGTSLNPAHTIQISNSLADEMAEIRQRLEGGCGLDGGGFRRGAGATVRCLPHASGSYRRAGLAPPHRPVGRG